METVAVSLKVDKMGGLRVDIAALLFVFRWGVYLRRNAKRS